MDLSFIEDASKAHEVSPGLMKSGYFAYSPWSFVTITIFNALAAAMLIVPALPMMLILGLAVKLRDGGPVLYKGTRLGLSKKPFHMYKFRTLPVGSQKAMGARLVDSRVPVDRFSLFLRDTRLDELPQLFNILRGDMDFIGPRPVRPEIYDQQCADIPNYDQRFAVRPGLIGYAQLFTPHSAPKRLRALIDNKFVLRKRHLSWDVVIIAYTIFLVGRSVMVKGSRHLREAWQSRSGRYSESRVQERIRTSRSLVRIKMADGSEIDAELEDINDTHFKAVAAVPLPGDVAGAVLERRLTRLGKNKTKRARCEVEPFKSIALDDQGRVHAHIFKYSPASPLNRYLVDQYFMSKSIV